MKNCEDWSQLLVKSLFIILLQIEPPRGFNTPTPVCKDYRVQFLFGNNNYNINNNTTTNNNKSCSVKRGFKEFAKSIGSCQPA